MVEAEEDSKPIVTEEKAEIAEPELITENVTQDAESTPETIPETVVESEILESSTEIPVENSVDVEKPETPVKKQETPVQTPVVTPRENSFEPEKLPVEDEPTTLEITEPSTVEEPVSKPVIDVSDALNTVRALSEPKTDETSKKIEIESDHFVSEKANTTDKEIAQTPSDESKPL